ncbi:hypothetical protein CLF_102033 [Clonorchis sinensis]|uniref:Uncharacterized protein n=1 Tax=Clonorchis sinensis TaxID=79923 RepID=G7Y751_CLOSI|nr:hypothetical protein CLF_102033 [Clonorchis sinensis]
MNYTYANKLRPHRPSRGFNSRVAFLAAYSRAGRALRTDDSIRHASVLRATSARHMAPASSGILKATSKPRRSVYPPEFNVRTLKKVDQQTALGLTLDSFGIDACLYEDLVEKLGRTCLVQCLHKLLSVEYRSMDVGHYGFSRVQCSNFPVNQTQDGLPQYNWNDPKHAKSTHLTPQFTVEQKTNNTHGFLDAVSIRIRNRTYQRRLNRKAA